MARQPPWAGLRSLLFAPANRPELIETYPRYRADAFAIDLEDGTPESAKAPARGDLPRMAAALRDGGVRGPLFVRINDSGSPHHEADLAVALETAIDGIMLPKMAERERP